MHHGTYETSSKIWLVHKRWLEHSIAAQITVHLPSIIVQTGDSSPGELPSKLLQTGCGWPGDKPSPVVLTAILHYNMWLTFGGSTNRWCLTRWSSCALNLLPGCINTPSVSSASMRLQWSIVTSLITLRHVSTNWNRSRSFFDFQLARCLGSTGFLNINTPRYFSHCKEPKIVVKLNIMYEFQSTQAFKTYITICRVA